MLVACPPMRPRCAMCVVQCIARFALRGARRASTVAQCPMHFALYVTRLCVVCVVHYDFFVVQGTLSHHFATLSILPPGPRPTILSVHQCS